MRDRTSYLLFDFDGTLVDHDKQRIYSQIIEEVIGSPDDGLAQQLKVKEIERNRQDEYDRRRVFLDFPQLTSHRTPADLARMYWRIFQQTQVLKTDALHILDHLRQRGYSLACVTDTDGPDGRKRDRVRSSISADHIPDETLFIGMEQGLPSKGGDAYLRSVLQRLGAAPEQCVMIGDKINADIAPADSLGMPAILVYNPDYPSTWKFMVSDLAELPAIIERLL